MGRQDITSSVTVLTNKENPIGILAKMCYKGEIRPPSDFYKATFNAKRYLYKSKRSPGFSENILLSETQPQR